MTCLRIATPTSSASGRCTKTMCRPETWRVEYDDAAPSRIIIVTSDMIVFIFASTSVATPLTTTPERNSIVTLWPTRDWIRTRRLRGGFRRYGGEERGAGGITVTLWLVRGDDQSLDSQAVVQVFLDAVSSRGKLTRRSMPRQYEFKCKLPDNFTVFGSYCTALAISMFERYSVKLYCTVYTSSESSQLQIF